jgi:hypothetical protein
MNVVPLSPLPVPPDRKASPAGGQGDLGARDTTNLEPFGPLSLEQAEVREARFGAMAGVEASQVSEMFDPSDDTPTTELATVRPLSAARGELAACIDQLAAAQREAEVAAAPAQRLAAVVAELERAERELAELRAAYELGHRRYSHKESRWRSEFEGVGRGA